MSSECKRDHSPVQWFLLVHMIISYINAEPYVMKYIHLLNDIGVMLCSGEWHRGTRLQSARLLRL